MLRLPQGGISYSRIPIALILEARVVVLMPRSSAAPPGPETFPPLRARDKSNKQKLTIKERKERARRKKQEKRNRSYGLIIGCSEFLPKDDKTSSFSEDDDLECGLKEDSMDRRNFRSLLLLLSAALSASVFLTPLTGCGGGEDKPKAELQAVMVYYAMPG